MITDMTRGSTAGVLWRFTLPMLGSVIFQQIYNIADSVIAGKFAGEDALSAVGVSYPVTMLFMAVAIGCNIGCSVVISQLFGSGRIGEMKTAVGTSFISVGVLSLILTVMGGIFSEPIMRLLKTPENVFADGVLYLNIYIWGLLFLFSYNIASGIFTALGDSQTPFYFLIASSIGNVVLDIVFVLPLKMGVAGVAWATFIAQGVAAVLSVAVLLRRLSRMETAERCPVFSVGALIKIFTIAIPSILQQSFISVGNLFIQAIINDYGSSVAAGYSAAIKLNTFALTSFTALSNAVSSFTAQNIGAGRIDRVKGGFKTALVILLCVVAPFLVAYCGFGGTILRIFMDSDSQTALSVGKSFLTIVSPFYIVISVKLAADGVLRGAGAMGLFMTSTFADLVLRVILAYIFEPIWQTDGIWFSWPVGWTVAAVLSTSFCLAGLWIPKSMRNRKGADKNEAV